LEKKFQNDLKFSNENYLKTEKQNHSEIKSLLAKISQAELQTNNEK